MRGSLLTCRVGRNGRIRGVPYSIVDTGGPVSRTMLIRAYLIRCTGSAPESKKCTQKMQKKKAIKNAHGSSIDMYNSDVGKRFMK